MVASASRFFLVGKTLHDALLRYFAHGCGAYPTGILIVRMRHFARLFQSYSVKENGAFAYLPQCPVDRFTYHRTRIGGVLLYGREEFDEIGIWAFFVAHGKAGDERETGPSDKFALVGCPHEYFFVRQRMVGQFATDDIAQVSRVEIGCHTVHFFG